MSDSRKIIQVTYRKEAQGQKHATMAHNASGRRGESADSSTLVLEYRTRNKCEECKENVNTPEDNKEHKGKVHREINCAAGMKIVSGKIHVNLFILLQRIFPRGRIRAVI